MPIQTRCPAQSRVSGVGALLGCQIFCRSARRRSAPLAAGGGSRHAQPMFAVTEAEVAMIRNAMDEGGEMSYQTPSSCAGCSPASPTTPRRGSVPGSSRDGLDPTVTLVANSMFAEVLVGASPDQPG